MTLNEIEICNDFRELQERASMIGLKLVVSDYFIIKCGDDVVANLTTLKSVHDFLSGWKICFEKYRNQKNGKEIQLSSLSL